MNKNFTNLHLIDNLTDMVISQISKHKYQKKIYRK